MLTFRRPTIGSVHLELRLRLRGRAPNASPEGRLKLAPIGGAGCGGASSSEVTASSWQRRIPSTSSFVYKLFCIHIIATCPLFHGDWCLDDAVRSRRHHECRECRECFSLSHTLAANTVNAPILNTRRTLDVFLASSLDTFLHFSLGVSFSGVLVICSLVIGRFAKPRCCLPGGGGLTDMVRLKRFAAVQVLPTITKLATPGKVVKLLLW